MRRGGGNVYIIAAAGEAEKLAFYIGFAAKGFSSPKREYAVELAEDAPVKIETSAVQRQATNRKTQGGGWGTRGGIHGTVRRDYYAFIPIRREGARGGRRVSATAYGR